MSQISALPLGYLALIGAETGGRFPPASSDALSPIIDTTPLYMQHRMGIASQTFNHNAVGLAESIEIPAGETWLIYSLNVSVTFSGANQLERWSVRAQRLPQGDALGPISGGFGTLWVTRRMEFTVLGDRASDAILLPQPFAMTGGSRLRFNLDERGPGPARVTRLEAVVARLSR